MCNSVTHILVLCGSIKKEKDSKMKSRICILSIVLISFFVQDSFSDSNKSNTNSSTDLTESKKDICWTGTLNRKTPVFIHYQFDNEVIIGEIVYLNSKNKTPIKLIGTIEDWDKKYRLLEFDRTGNITGIITGLPEKDKFNGSWFSPKTSKELTINLSTKDTVIISKDYQPRLSEIFGDYHYQYGKAGYQGDFNVTKISKSSASFNIFSVTEEPARNIAEITTDTIKLTKPEFIYKVPETEDCEFKVKFYRDFVFINYTKGTCEGQFGHNATVDGIFIKTK